MERLQGGGEYVGAIRQLGLRGTHPDLWGKQEGERKRERKGEGERGKLINDYVCRGI